jgi:hypothetical protein
MTKARREKYSTIDEADRHLTTKGLKVAGEFIIYPSGAAIFSIVGFNSLVNGLSTGDPERVASGLGALALGGVFGYGIKRAFDHFRKVQNLERKFEEFKSRTENQ